MPILLLRSFLAILVCLTSSTYVGADDLIDEVKLKRETGQLDEVKIRLENLLTHKTDLEPLYLWQVLIAHSWILEIRGQYKESIEELNEALDIASKAGNPFHLGRTLSYLGWSFAAMGKYEAASKFYEEAINLSSDGKGNPNNLVMIWGLSTQELGSLYIKMGKPKEGRALVEKTTNFARQNKIATGVAEGGNRLAELALFEGNITEALALSEEAVVAAKECDCSPFNTTQALLIRAKAKWYAVKDISSEKWIDIRKEFEEVLTAARVAKIKPIEAEALFLLSQTHPKDTHKRLELLESALSIMNQGDYELRGITASEAGRVYFEARAPELAAHYLKYGIKVTDEMMRAVDKSRMVEDQAILATMTGESKQEVELLLASVSEALRQEQIEDAVTRLEKLVIIYQKNGYLDNAAKASEQALPLIKKLLDAAPPPEKKEFLENKLVILKEIITAVRVQGAI